MTTVADSRRTAPARPILTESMQPKRRWSLLVGGLLLVLLCAGVFVAVQLRGDARVQVLAVARPVAAGQSLVAADLKPVKVVPDPQVPLVPASEAQQLVGRTAAVPLASGSLLAESQLGPAAWPAAGQAVVAAGFKEGRVPAGLAAGSRVLVVSVDKDTLSGSSDTPSSEPKPVSATAVDVAPGPDGSGTTTVSLLVDRGDATKLAGTGSDLALVLVGG
ncbi:MAG: hypothetical protein QOH97_1472 [Actinoplanes sp.]|jgi:hypothetical protein|nr:hypothetical protein [Actinoplanes sp.]